MVDIHTHILPGVDDGSKSWEMTAEMCRMAIEDGVTHMVASPHCNDVYTYNRERFTAMLGELSDAGQGRLTFSLGCDFHFSYENVQDALENPRRYTIGDTPYLLVEFNDFSLPPEVMQNLMDLKTCGMHPIITHPERTRTTLARPEVVLEMAAQGHLIQVTAGSFTGFWGPRCKRMAEWLLEHHAIHVVASDTHDPRNRKPGMSQAREVVSKLAGEPVAEALFLANPAAIVDGQTVPYQPQAG